MIESLKAWHDVITKDFINIYIMHSISIYYSICALCLYRSFRFASLTLYIT